MNSRISRRQLIERAAAATAALVAGCTRPSSQTEQTTGRTAEPAQGSGATPAVATPVPAEPVTLTFMHFMTAAEGDPAGSVWTQTVDEFLKQHPNVTLQQDTMSHDEYLTKFKTLAAANELPDVFLILADQITPLGVNAKVLLDYVPAFEKDPEWKEAQAPGILDEFTRQGHVYAMAIQMIWTHLFYWNEAIFREVGISEFPRTWQEFEDAVAKLKDARYVPIGLGNKAQWVVLDPVWGTLAFRTAGRDWYDRMLEHRAKYTDPEFVRSFEVLKRVVDIGAFNEDMNSLDNSQQRTLFYNKKAAMFIEGNWAIGAVVNDAPQEVLESTRLGIWPPVPGGKGRPSDVTGGCGWGLAINAKLSGSKLDTALRLVKQLTSVEYGRRRIEAGLLPAQTVADYDKSKVPLLAQELLEKMQSFTMVPIFTNWTPTSIFDMLATGLQNVMVGKVTPQELGAQLQAEWEKYQS